MDLLEYQAKQLFAQVEIPVLPSQSLLNASDLKNLHIPYPVVLKSQVFASERIKYGGVRFVENTIDAIAVAQSLFNSPIKGEYPPVILAEARYDVENELFLAIIIDYALKKPVLLGSAHGGGDIELLLKNLQTCVIEEEFSPFHARYLANQMGLIGAEIAPVANTLEKMYQLLIHYDLDLIEINPLGINQNGEVMALDGKIRVNDYALTRHPKLLQDLNLEIHSQNNTENYLNKQILKKDKEWYDVLNLDLHSNLMVITGNIDQTVFLLNTLKTKQQPINSFYILPLKNQQFWQNNIYQLLLKIIQSERIEKVLINHSNQDQFTDILLAKITGYYQQQNQTQNLYSEERLERPTGVRLQDIASQKTFSSFLPQRKIHWIIRKMSVIDSQELKQQSTDLPIDITISLEEAIRLIKKEQC